MAKAIQKILIFNNTGNYIINFRRELIIGLQNAGYDVCAAFPYDGAQEELERIKVTCINFELDSYSKNIFIEALTIIRVAKLAKKLEIDLILGFTIKPVLYSSIATLFSRCNVVSTITGLGIIYTDESLKYRILSCLTNFAYMLSFTQNPVVIFQNPDDRNYFVEHRILPKEKAKLVNGSGVNLDKFQFRLRTAEEKASFLMVARLLKEKGVLEYCRAAKNIISKYQCKCSLVGDNISGKELVVDGMPISEYCLEHGINYLGRRHDVSKILEDHTIFVLPSYREGTPRSTLEALSSGMPTITTDAPGTKETVQHEINGILISTKSEAELENAMSTLIEQKQLITSMSLASRAYAEKKFNVAFIVREYVEVVNQIMNRRAN